MYVGTGTGVYVYTYPNGKLLGSLGVSGLFLCTDHAQNVFVPAGNFQTQILVYAHGAAQPKVTLNDPYSAVDCAVDPSSETLAVSSGFGGGIVVFPYNRKRGWRYAQTDLVAGAQSVEFCAYDDKGDLFVDGKTSSQDFFLAELPRGSTTFSTITLDRDIAAPGSMQWDGKYLAVADFGTSNSSASVIYRFALSGSSGSAVSTTSLNLSRAGAQFWIEKNRVIGPLAHESSGTMGVWRFPRGGAPVKIVAEVEATGEAVSLKPNKRR